MNMNFKDLLDNLEIEQEYYCTTTGHTAIMTDRGLIWHGNTGAHGPVRITMELVHTEWVEAPVEETDFQSLLNAVREGRFAAVSDSGCEMLRVRFGALTGELIYERNQQPVRVTRNMVCHVRKRNKPNTINLDEPMGPVELD
jgi:hypothetical protein